MKTILEFVFNGTPDNFIEVAIIFGALHREDFIPYRWESKDPARHIIELVGYSTSLYDSGLSIKAVILPNNRSRLLVMFPAGAYDRLLGYWEQLRDDLRRQGWNVVPLTAPIVSGSSGLFVPTNKKALDRYKKYYRLILRLRKKYFTDFKEGDTEKPEPDIGDYVEFIKTKEKVNIGEKTVRRILAAGDNDLLK